MRILIIAAVAFLGLGCRKAQVAEVKKAAQDARAGDTAATRYVTGLQADVTKAEENVKKANAATGQTTQEVDKALQAEGQ